MKNKLNRIKHLEDQEIIGGVRDIIICGDSKAWYFMSEVHHDSYININHRGGATIRNTFLGYHTLNRIHHAFKPIVILWFGTCELTPKHGKYVRLVDDIDRTWMKFKLNIVKTRIKFITQTVTVLSYSLIAPYIALPYGINTSDITIRTVFKPNNQL